jgi:2-phospho-L-lactate guanylyltransferase
VNSRVEAVSRRGRRDLRDSSRKLPSHVEGAAGKPTSCFKQKPLIRSNAHGCPSNVTKGKANSQNNGGKRLHSQAGWTMKQIARLMHVHFLWEGKRRGLNKGIQLALHDAKRRKFSAALIVPSDIPLITPRELGHFLRFSDGYPISLAPSKDGHGTNALFMRPPGIIRPAFGRNSFRRHQSVANRKGLSARVVRSTGIAFDVDEPADLASLKRLSLRNETGRFLKSQNFAGASKTCTPASKARKKPTNTSNFAEALCCEVAGQSNFNSLVTPEEGST